VDDLECFGCSAGGGTGRAAHATLEEREYAGDGKRGASEKESAAGLHGHLLNRARGHCFGEQTAIDLRH
jgi:hypothetical protein